MSKWPIPILSNKGPVAPWDDSKTFGTPQVSYLDDGRPVLSETWSEYGYTFITFCFSHTGLEESDLSAILNYLYNQGLLKAEDLDVSKKALRQIIDDHGHQCWVLTITVGEADEDDFD